jgi:hypothetical protein
VKTIYVAGSSKEAVKIAGYMQRLRDMGWTVTHDWTVPVLEAKVADGDLSDHERIRLAVDDSWGVRTAGYFWLVIPETGSLGSWVELGIAIGLRCTIIVSGDCRKSIFLTLAGEEFREHEEALTFFQGIET